MPLLPFLPHSLTADGEHPRRDGPTRGAEPVCTILLASHRCCGRDVLQGGDDPVRPPPAGTIGPLPPTSPPSPGLGPSPSPAPLRGICPCRAVPCAPPASPLLPAAGQGLVAAWCRHEGHPQGMGRRSQPARLPDGGPDPWQRRAPGAGLRGRQVPGILPAPVGGCGMKPAKRREKQIKLFPFSRNNCLPNYCRNYCPKGEGEGEESSVGRGQESQTRGGVWREAPRPTRDPPQLFPASPPELQDRDPGSIPSTGHGDVTKPEWGRSKAGVTCSGRE